MPDHQNQPEDSAELTEVRFKRPDSYVVSVRLNREESRTLTEGARRVGEKLSTFIKAAALETCQRRQTEQSNAKFEIGGSDAGTAWTVTQSRGTSPSAGAAHAEITPLPMRQVG